MLKGMPFIRFISRASCRSENCQSAAQADGDKDKVGERDRFARGFYRGCRGTGDEGITAFRDERQGGGCLFLQ